MSLRFRHPRRPPSPVSLVTGSCALLLPLLLSVASPLRAQERTPPAGGDRAATVAVAEENFRADPNGIVLARIVEGSRLTVAAAEAQWVEADLEGWVWARSLQVLARPDFDLIVSAEGGENLRSEPSGTVLARLEEGTFLEELERVPGWIRVRRRGWIWRASTRISGADGRADATVVRAADERRIEPTGAGADAGSAGGRSVEVGADAASAGGGSVDAAAVSADRGSVEVEGSWSRTPERGAVILTAPDGDTLGRAQPGAELRVLGRQGSWARVRVEGWSWLPEGESEGGEEAVVRDATPADVSADPDRFRGRIVAWELQFISLERAEEVRTDFYEGEPFLLTRATGDERRFVYVAIPSERSGEITGLSPLERIRVVGRVRTGSAALTGSPILDLLEWSRVPSSGESPRTPGS